MDNKIVWQKWIDPFLSNVDEVDPEAIEVKDKDEDDEEDEDDFRDSYERFENKIMSMNKDSGKKAKKRDTGPVILGPMGIVPINEHNSPSKLYCFWMGHTNFDITERVANQIEKVPGVESLDVFSRYRFRIAIGKAFLDEKTDPFGREVLKAIQVNTCKKAEQEKGESKDKMKKKGSLIYLKESMKKKYPYWAIAQADDGQYKTSGGNSKEEIEQELAQNNFKVLATSWE